MEKSRDHRGKKLSLTGGSRNYMAGYTSRNFLSLTIPSVLGLSIIWFLKKRSDSKKTSRIQVEDIQSDNTDQYLSFLPMKLKSQETSSVGETACAEMQLKETESRAEAQHQACNGTSQQTPKVKGNMARFCENGSSCSMDEPITNSHGKDNVLRRNSDSKIELTNGMNALCLNGVSSSKESLTNGICKSINMEKVTNGFTNTNGVVKLKDSIASKSDVEVDQSSSQELAGAKELFSSVCNGSRSKDTKRNLSSKDATLPAKELFTSSLDTAVVCNGFSSVSIDTTQTNTQNALKVIDTNEHSSTQSECVAANSDELCQPDDKAEPPTTHCSIVLDAAESSVNTLNEDANPILTSTVLTDAGQVTPPVDYVVADSTELLTLPIDDTGVETQGEMLESPGATYCDSLVSYYIDTFFLNFVLF